MDPLIDLALRAGLLLLLSPTLLGAACALTALYGVGSGWPDWIPAALGALTLGLWSFSVWRMVRRD